MTPARYTRLCKILDHRQLDLTVVMENVRKPHNIGAIVRTCDAVGIHEIHAVSGSTSPHTTGELGSTRPSRRAQSAAGSGRYVAIRSHASIEDAAATLRHRGFALITADAEPNSIDYRQADLTKPIALVLGSEGSGLTSSARTIADYTISIPMLGAVSSLNVSVAAAIILFEAQRQRLENGNYRRSRMSDELRQELLFEWGYPRVADLFRRQQTPYPQLGPEGELRRTDLPIGFSSPR